MAVRFTKTGLIADDKNLWHSALGFLDTVFRGVGQVMLQDNSYTGLLFVIGIFYNSWLFGVGVLVGTAVSTLTAMLFGTDCSQVRKGLYGFNGALVAIALLYFLQPNALTWVCVIFAAACSTIVMTALTSLLNVWKLPALTAPFVFTSFTFFLAIARFGRLASTHLLPTAGLPTAVSVEGVVNWTTVVEGLFKGVAQVFFQGNLVTGIIFAAGLFVAARMAFATALIGSLIGLLVAWGMGAAEPAIRAGAFGFNGVLVAIALGSVFFALNKTSIAYALLATIATPFVYAAVSAALQPLGVPALTLPFVLVTWTFLFASKLFPTLHVAKAEDT